MKGLEYIQSQLTDYELIDSGDGMKLERFGALTTARPEPQAIWRRSLPEAEWDRLADAVFRRDGKSKEGKNDERGQWQKKPKTPDRWTFEYGYKNMQLRMRLALTGFKHVGVFPEQAENWNFIYDTIREFRTEKTATQQHPKTATEHSEKTALEVPKILNLFAYTGGATLAARSAGAEVTHVDSIKQTVGWARENMELSGLTDTSEGGGAVRWIVDDALKFVRREARRGNSYDGIVLDPPAYGRGPEGEKWVLEDNIDEMLGECAALLKPHGFLVLNLYSMGLSALLARTAVHRQFFVNDCTTDSCTESEAEQFGELYFADRAGKDLPLGVYYRFVR